MGVANKVASADAAEASMSEQELPGIARHEVKPPNSDQATSATCGMTVLQELLSPPSTAGGLCGFFLAHVPSGAHQGCARGFRGRVDIRAFLFLRDPFWKPS